MRKHLSLILATCMALNSPHLLAQNKNSGAIEKLSANKEPDESGSMINYIIFGAISVAFAAVYMSNKLNKLVFSVPYVEAPNTLNRVLDYELPNRIAPPLGAGPSLQTCALVIAVFGVALIGFLRLR